LNEVVDFGVCDILHELGRIDDGQDLLDVALGVLALAGVVVAVANLKPVSTECLIKGQLEPVAFLELLQLFLAKGLLDG
jgi:hypothetical protein